MIFFLGKKGVIPVDETVRWIGYLGLLAAASFAAWKIVSNVTG